MDNESGLPHIGHILCNVVFLSDMYLKENQLK